MNEQWLIDDVRGDFPVGAKDNRSANEACMQHPVENLPAQLPFLSSWALMTRQALNLTGFINRIGAVVMVSPRHDRPHTASHRQPEYTLNILSSRAVSSFCLMALLALVGACGGGGSGSSSTTPTTPVVVTPTAAAVSLSASLTAVASDNSNTSTITATVVDSSNAAVPGVPVSFSVDSGFLSASSAVSDATGKAVVTFSAGSNPTTRTATIVATASGKTSQIPVRVAGSSLTLTTSSSSLLVGGAPATLTIVAKNSSGGILTGQTITLTQLSTSTGSVTLGAASGTTDASGTLTTTITPVAAGTVNLSASGVGELRTISVSVTGASSAFQITTLSTDPTLNGKTINTAIPVTVSAPSPTTTVTFATTLGTWDGTSSNVVTKTVASGSVTAVLTTPSAGVANIQAYDNDTVRRSTISDARIVSFTAACNAASKVTLQSTPSVVAPSSGGTSNISTLLATVTDAVGNPVGACSLAFNLVNPTGGGETVSPAVVLTSSVSGGSGGSGLGQATATFASGSLSSGAGGVQIRATVVRDPALALPIVKTGTAPSGSDATVVIGGTAGSVTIGQSTVATDSGNGTIYVLPMSVLVADSNGNPVANSIVSLSAWPIAFNVGGNACNAAPTALGGVFYYNEDANENLVLDTNMVTGGPEDGTRRLYGTNTYQINGSRDGQLTPPNSAAGTLPATVTTGSNGVATFSLTYTKSSARYIADRIRARTVVQGTETLGEVTFGLPALLTDIGPPCVLSPSSPYAF